MNESRVDTLQPLTLSEGYDIYLEGDRKGEPISFNDFCATVEYWQYIADDATIPVVLEWLKQMERA